MHPLKWIILSLALFQGGWLLFDGGRALIVGDYVTPASGPRAGQLGPWSRVVSAIGFDPRGNFIKGVHVLLGTAWLASMAVFAFKPAAGWWCVLVCSAASLWYLPVGTLLSLVQIGLLLAVHVRKLQ